MKQEPTVSAGMRGKQRLDHDAFGTIVLTSPQGNIGTLFGSDLRHSSCLAIEIRRADKQRDLGRDWIHGDELVCRIEMTHAQFAEFITSVGKAEGTPCTIDRAPARGTAAIKMPEIMVTDSTLATHKREVQESVNQAIADMKQKIADLGAMIEAGRTSKKEMKAIHHSLSCTVGNLPLNMAYAVECTEKAVTKSVTAAKIDVEAYISNTAKRLGLEHLQNMLPRQISNTDDQDR